MRVERVVFIVKLLSFERSARADGATPDHFQNNMDLTATSAGIGSLLEKIKNSFPLDAHNCLRAPVGSFVSRWVSCLEASSYYPAHVAFRHALFRASNY